MVPLRSTKIDCQVFKTSISKDPLAFLPRPHSCVPLIPQTQLSPELPLHFQGQLFSPDLLEKEKVDRLINAIENLKIKLLVWLNKIDFSSLCRMGDYSMVKSARQCLDAQPWQLFQRT